MVDQPGRLNPAPDTAHPITLDAGEGDVFSCSCPLVLKLRVVPSPASDSRFEQSFLGNIFTSPAATEISLIAAAR
jgi:hypothetical protein